MHYPNLGRVSDKSNTCFYLMAVLQDNRDMLIPECIVDFSGTNENGGGGDSWS